MSKLLISVMYFTQQHGRLMIFFPTLQICVRCMIVISAHDVPDCLTMQLVSLQ